MISRLGVVDATAMACQLGQIDSSDLINLPNYRMYCRVMIDGLVSKAFSARSLKGWKEVKPLMTAGILFCEGWMQSRAASRSRAVDTSCWENDFAIKWLPRSQE